MRKSTCMNDFMEIEHGFNCLQKAYADHKARFVALLEPIFPGFSTQIEERFNAWLPSFRTSTYISCISEHHDSEDTTGRLSMWRAYGGPTGVALVVRGAPFLRPTDALDAYTSPVAYLDAEQFSDQYKILLDNIESNLPYILKLSLEQLLAHFFEVFKMATLCTKHPGFAEEREWRIIYSPTLRESQKIKAGVVSISGVPQRIYKIPLKNVHEQGLFGIEVRELLERMIIGPTQFPIEIKEALMSVLNEKGIENPYDLIKISDIPLRN